MNVTVSIGLMLFPAAGVCRAQSAAPAANTVVKAETLAVHSEARGDSDVVQTLKKGDALVVGLELKIGAEKWCSVSFPGQRKLGFVECDGLERTDKRPGDLALPADAPPSSGETSIVGGPSKSSAVRLPRAHSSIESSNEYLKVAGAVVHDEILDGAKIAEFERAAGRRGRGRGRHCGTTSRRISSWTTTILSRPSSSIARRCHLPRNSRPSC